jgi:hypothetical protein
MWRIVLDGIVIVAVLSWVASLCVDGLRVSQASSKDDASPKP